MAGQFFPALTPTYGLGSYSRTRAAIMCGNPRVRIGTQNRIYYWYKHQGKGQLYKAWLLTKVGPA